ncbi:hypothetical protein LWI28_022939 [Acer negundo]|uniref:Reverse transcriptase/retrotransposon-derived protein RNase H-like domain-containing protein n=1 Tax=Acer negundo TaxID=4023 RepID=A0AAD5INN8_ACENE|nr:hypothetical protein LWI28_022939 [Acer negundo]
MWSTNGKRSIDKAFAKIKETLANAPVMMAPIAGKEKSYILFYAIGIVLAQDDQNGQEKPIFYASRILKKAPPFYSIQFPPFLPLPSKLPAIGPIVPQHFVPKTKALPSCAISLLIGLRCHCRESLPCFPHRYFFHRDLLCRIIPNPMKRTRGSIRGIQIHSISKSEAVKSKNAYLAGSSSLSADQRDAAFPYMYSLGVALGMMYI